MSIPASDREGEDIPTRYDDDILDDLCYDSCCNKQESEPECQWCGDMVGIDSRFCSRSCWLSWGGQL